MEAVVGEIVYLRTLNPSIPFRCACGHITYRHYGDTSPCGKCGYPQNDENPTSQEEWREYKK